MKKKFAKKISSEKQPAINNDTNLRNKSTKKFIIFKNFVNLKVVFILLSVFFLFGNINFTTQQSHGRHQHSETYINDADDAYVSSSFYSSSHLDNDNEFLPLQSSFKELSNVDSKNDYIFLNTIDGNFYAVGKHDGKIRWSLKEEPILKIPKNYENPYFLTDPRDGSLYIFTNKKEGLKKFPYTIAELVSASPSKTSDGYLFTGDKKDQWLAIDYRSGLKVDTLTSDTLGSSSKISLSGGDSTGDSNILFIGRTKYTISMFDINTRKKTFNLTYYDYSTHTTTYNMNNNQNQNKSNKDSNTNENFDQSESNRDDSTLNSHDSQFPLNKVGSTTNKDYQYYHFTSSSDGTLITLDRQTGELIWQLRLDTPIIGMYLYENDQLFKINFAIFAVEALTNGNPDRYKLLFLEQKYQEKQKLIYDEINIDNKNPVSSNIFAYTLYIGFYKNNLYALPALIYNWHIPGIEGPQIPSSELQPIPFPNSNNLETFTPSSETAMTNTINKENSLIVKETSTSSSSTADKIKGIKIGHHKLPEKFKPPPNYIQTNTKHSIFGGGENKKSENKFKKTIGDDDNPKMFISEIFGFNLNGDSNLPKQPLCPVIDKTSVSGSGIIRHTSLSLWKKFDQLMQNKYFFMVFTLLLGSLIPMFKNIYDERKKRNRRNVQKQIQRALNEKLNLDISEDSSSASTSVSSSYTGDLDDDNNTTEKKDSKSSSHTKNLQASNKTDASENSSPKTSSKTKTKSSSKKKSTSNNDDDNNANGNVENITIKDRTSIPEVDKNGLIKIGKITYDPKQVIGHGCAGTFVYKGIFEKRPVAVKRILPECYMLADREVDLLRDADQHKNVLRYFCTESDSQFRYIALELCQMTLNEFVLNQNKLNYAPPNPALSNSVKKIEDLQGSNKTLKPLNILEQATKGLDHLHSLDIVHRDIKPHNVLISFPDQKGQIFVMISDFGLCKRLELGNNSFSKKSGITGTDGWIAPELIEDDCFLEKPDENASLDSFCSYQPKRVTKNVDVFSLGCVYYFVLTGGSHPFGDSIRRQANILCNQYKLDKLVTYNPETYMQRLLIEKMISNDSKLRPNTRQILSHPIFWSKSKKLQFLQDVSDRIEKLEADDPLIIELEKNANVTIKNNWKTHICAELTQDLKKFRTYNGLVLRDLLRIIRNKKHHYRELSPELKQSLGSLPDEFTDYFTSRFPKLILHVYEVMKCCSHENVIDVYYKINDNHI